MFFWGISDKKTYLYIGVEKKSESEWIRLAHSAWEISLWILPRDRVRVNPTDF